MDNLSLASIIEHINNAKKKELEAVAELDKELDELHSQIKEIKSQIKYKCQRASLYERCLEILDPVEPERGINSSPAEARSDTYLDELIKTSERGGAFP